MNPNWNFWKLHTTELGRQTWQFSGNNEDAAFILSMANSFVFDKKKNANSADKVYRYQKKISSPHTPSDNSLLNAINYYISLFSEHGFVPGDYGGPMFLIPGLIIVSYVTNTPLPLSHQALICQYIKNHQNTDGGWGLHIESDSTMFGSVMNYVTLRLLGIDASEKFMMQARSWILQNGSATSVPSWGKFYLSVLNVYDWKGCNSLFPEIWLFPKSLPFHPWRYWCHARMVYLPMAYAFGYKISHPLNELTTSIRNEIYSKPYNTINWAKARNHCCSKDVYHKASPIIHVMHAFTNLYEKVVWKSLRKKALQFILRYIDAEDEHTHFINIGPVNQAINSLCVWHGHGKESIQFKKHTERWFDYLWVAEDGMKMQGYNGAQLWETAFTVNAIAASKYAIQYEQELRKMYQFIDISQIKENIPETNSFFRHQRKGGWPFSTVEHGWPITDCTGDGVKAVLKIHELFAKHGLKLTNPIQRNRLEEAIDLMLTFQSDDGGWASYEKRRGPFWLEHLNPSEVFGEIMVDYSYVECTSSTIQALQIFNKHYPDYKPQCINKAITSGLQFIKNKQRSDGSWYGSWGVCFTYAHWFAHEAYACTHSFYSNNSVVAAACDFLVSKQQANGAWGESYESCVTLEYVQHEQGQIINTAWAVLALIASKYPNSWVIERGIAFIKSKQFADGDFPQEGISGVFNKNCMETYTSYRNVFPIWALAAWDAKQS